jgi:hypothetical protein
LSSNSQSMLSKEAVTHYPPPRHIEFCNDPA